MPTTYATLRRRLGFLVWIGDCRSATLAYALAAGAFGFVVAAGDVWARLAGEHQTDVEASLYGAFETVPGWLLGSAFAACAVALALGVLLEQQRTVQRASLGCMTLWAYTFVSIPVWMALDGHIVPTAVARYGTPFVVGWWVYLRAPTREDGHAWGRGSGLRWPLAVLAAGVPVVALPLPSDLTGPALLSAAVAVLTLAGKWLADRLRSRTDYATAVATAAGSKDQFLWGLASGEITRLAKEVEHLRAQLSAHLQLWEDRDKFCRNTCSTYKDRP